MADLYGVAIGGGLSGNVDANARKLLGDGASGVGPYTSFGTPKLQAIKVVSATINFTTTPTIAGSNLAKAVFALQGLAEIYYVGIPTASGANQFIALVNLNKTDSGDGYANANELGTSYENIEDSIRAALGTAEDDVTVTNVTLTGLTFA
jgi:hypothetical protein